MNCQGFAFFTDDSRLNSLKNQYPSDWWKTNWPIMNSYPTNNLNTQSVSNIASIRSGQKITKAEYEVLEKVCENSGKNISKATKFIAQNPDLASDIAKVSESALEDMIDIVGEKTARKFVKHSNHAARGKKGENMQ